MKANWNEPLFPSSSVNVMFSVVSLSGLKSNRLIWIKLVLPTQCNEIKKMMVRCSYNFYKDVHDEMESSLRLYEHWANPETENGTP